MNLNVNFYLGNIIRKYRESRNFTQEQMASLANIDKTYYGRIERGEYNVTVATCQKIASALEIPLYLLFTDLPE